MRGLLLKDFYMLLKYGKIFFVVVILCSALIFVGENSSFYFIYPSFLCGMMSMTLIGYDEREKWNIYSRTLPYSQTQLVSVKYLIGFAFQSVVWLISISVYAVHMIQNGTFVLETYLLLISVFFAVSSVGQIFILPFIFALGVEKGRIAYYVVIGVIFALGAIITEIPFPTWEVTNTNWIAGMVFVGILVLYLVSWKISVELYKKREM